MIAHCGQAQRFSHAIVMVAKSLNKEPPKLFSLAVNYSELEHESKQRLNFIQQIVRRGLGCFMSSSFQRVERALVILAGLIDRLHDSLVPADQLRRIHLGNKVQSADCIVSGSVFTKQATFAFQAFPQLSIW